LQRNTVSGSMKCFKKTFNELKYFKGKNVYYTSSSDRHIYTHVQTRLILQQALVTARTKNCNCTVMTNIKFIHCTLTGGLLFGSVRRTVTLC